MPQVGPLELIVVALVALIVFGPDKLPEVARTVGRTINELRRQAAEVRGEFVRGITEEESDEIQVTDAPAPTAPEAPDSSNGAGPNG